jgi:hypothetical protein
LHALHKAHFGWHRNFIYFGKDVMADNEQDINQQVDNNDMDKRRSAASLQSDLPDSPQDEQRMQSEEVILDLPDVKDIPGQEHILPPRMDSFSDTTISSDDEEGAGIFGDDDIDKDTDTDVEMGTEADVTGTEKQLLDNADKDMPTQDDTNLRMAELDAVDDDGDLLNEGSLATSVSGADLDTSGVDSDDPMESIGEEDEENNTYSLGSDSNDNVTEGTP